MTKNLISDSILARLAELWSPIFFIRGFYLYQMLDIVANYHRMQFQGKPMIQTQGNGEKTHFQILFRFVGPKFEPPFLLLSLFVCLFVFWVFFFQNLASSVTKYHGQLSSCRLSEKQTVCTFERLFLRQINFTNRQTDRRE